MSKTREEIIHEGIVYNKYRKLSRIWDQWQPFRAHRFGGSWQQAKANEICERIGPEIVALRHQLDASKARLTHEGVSMTMTTTTTNSLTPTEGLERLNRDSEFMKPAITRRQQWLKLDGTHGIVYVPRNDVPSIQSAESQDHGLQNTGLCVCGSLGCDGTPELDADTLNDLFGDYYEGTIESAEVVKGYGARLSAPGYMDCTEWGVFDTKDEAKAYLVETYADDCTDDDDTSMEVIL